ncbi:Histidine--tRNA ligase [Kineococcus radiotolerans SRS30216 = ATCC BAA-149]|uniref:Histidyl-tRNA synthetase n=2 Tax=Kineococcus radiotolerans TaxID=131568 RepID=A6W4Q0_KINRD|nr:Histidine--tRNA ligase [Kineococcus radiotolerans SRS30216 = ATCC BAA-149]
MGPMAAKVVPARGMRDVLPVDKARREHALHVIREVYRSFGFDEVETPALEELSRLESGQGGENEKMLFKVLRRGLPADEALLPGEAADLGLRFDLTVPLTRYVASNAAALRMPFKALQIGPVWRAERPQKGRYRQFVQCDIDIVGEPGSLAEVELVTATHTALTRLGLTGTTLRLNDRGVLTGLLTGCGFAADEHGSVLITVDKADKVGLDGVLAELRAKGFAEEHVAALEASLTALLPLRDVRTPGVLEAALPAAVPAEVVARLREIADALAVSAPDLEVAFDVTLVRGMGYYTGPIFEMSLPGSSSSIAGGGRYDNMVGRFSGRDLPAAGFSIGFERIVDEIAPRDEGVSAIALVHPAGADAGTLLRKQQELVAGGARVALVKQAKRMQPLFDALVAEGYSRVVRARVAEDGSLEFSDPAPLGASA